jgi:hypothetical protein
LLIEKCNRYTKKCKEVLKRNPYHTGMESVPQLTQGASTGLIGSRERRGVAEDAGYRID